jgi:hypothetical protein
VTPEEYLRRVGFRLNDLPWRTKRDLFAEIRGHLDELPADTDLEARLGTPEEYAADLRSAAGLERRRGPIAFLRARRPRNLLLTALALTVIGFAIGAVAWIDSYEPIAFAGATQLPLGSKPSPGQAGVTVVFRKGRPFRYGISVRNNGRYTVRVLGVPKSVTDFYSGRVLVSKPNPFGNERPLERFRPFDLNPGEVRWVLLTGVYACTTGMGAPGPGFVEVTWGSIPIRFSFLWRTATASITLDDPLTIAFSKEGCPPQKGSVITP